MISVMVADVAATASKLLAEYDGSPPADQHPLCSARRPRGPRAGGAVACSRDTARRGLRFEVLTSLR